MKGVNSIVVAIVAVTIFGIILIPTVAAIHTQGHVHHTMVDAIIPIWVVGELHYYLDTDSHYDYRRNRYTIDQAWDTLSYATYVPGVVYTNINHHYTIQRGVSNEYAWGTCSWENGIGFPTPWGWVWIQHYYHTAYIWVYASGSWTAQIY